MTRDELLELLTIERFAPYQPPPTPALTADPLPATRARQRTLAYRAQQRNRARERRAQRRLRVVEPTATDGARHDAEEATA